jgi:type III secretion protein V
MDGAMKFVKGDAIAGIVITLVNVLGGVTIGVVSRGLTLSASLKLYGLLTIGDGIVTQIPALLAATSAGLVVTRVASADGEGSLGRDIATQLFGDARVLAVGALLLGLIAIVPGMPSPPFLLAAALCAGLAWRARAHSAAAVPSAEVAPPHRLEPLAIELGSELAHRSLLRGAPTPSLADALTHARLDIVHTLGIQLPRPVLRENSAIAALGFRLIWREIAEPTQSAESASPETAIAHALTRLARRCADDCLGMEEVQRMLDEVERDKPALVRLTVPRMITLPVLAQVLRALVREGISVRWLSEILEAVAPLAEKDASPASLADAARKALSRRISQRLAPDGTLPILRLSPMLEETLHDALKHDTDRQWLALPASLAEEIVSDVIAAVRAHAHVGALLAPAALRRQVRVLLQDAAPDLAIVCPEELLPTTRLVLEATIGP